MVSLQLELKTDLADTHLQTQKSLDDLMKRMKAIEDSGKD